MSILRFKCDYDTLVKNYGPALLRESTIRQNYFFVYWNVSKEYTIESVEAFSPRDEYRTYVVLYDITYTNSIGSFNGWANDDTLHATYIAPMFENKTAAELLVYT
jgi:hypothetical protein